MLSRKEKINILFIESGTTGGGSFESLYVHVKSLNRDIFNPSILCFNRTVYNKLWEDLNLPVYTLYSHIYSIHNKSFLSIIYKKIYMVLQRYSERSLIIFLKYFLHKSLVYKISRIIREKKIKLVHLNNQIFRDIFGIFVVEKTRVACISHLRSMRSSGFNKYIANYVNPKVDLFIANSKKCKEHWSCLGIDEKKIIVVYNSISEYFPSKSNFRDYFSIPDKFTHIIGCIANFTEAKGHKFLITSFSELYKINKKFFLVLIGHGSLQGEIQKMVNYHGLSDAVQFVGYQNDSKSIIAMLDLLVVPSKNEAFGRSILEGMQVGTPVIATKIGGIPEIITNGHNGILVKYGDTIGLVQAIIKLTSDQKLKSKLIKNAYNTLEKKFSINQYSNQIENIYKSILGIS